VLSFGTGTFGGEGELFSAWGDSDEKGATRLIDICLDAGVNMFDSADGYSNGRAEEILGVAIAGRRDKVLISTKAAFRIGPDSNDVGSSRFALIRSIENALRRLKTDYIDLFQLHTVDALTPVEETLRTLDDLIRSGKIRYIGCSNFSGWHLMKSLAISEKYGLSRYVAHQAYYSLIGRDFEWDLMPLALDQRVGTVVWSPLGWGRLTGKIRRGEPIPKTSRRHSDIANSYGPAVSDDYFFRVQDAIEIIATETGKTVPQIAINWLLQRPTVSTVIIGARNEEQLRQNLGAVGWTLTSDQMQRLDQASAMPPIYPNWHHKQLSERNP
jgi:aryl-alcohol dehydrogenase-like predicted oxidoreductase